MLLDPRMQHGGRAASGSSKLKWMKHAKVNVNLTSVAANTQEEQTIPVPGAQIGDVAVVTPGNLSAGLAVGASRVSAADTVSVWLINTTAGALDPNPADFEVLLFRF